MDRFELFEPIYRLRIGGHSTKRSLIDWAVEQLGQGRETPNLLILAGLSPESHEVEVEEYFELTLRDLSQPSIGRVEQRLGEARAAASALLRGELQPVQCTELVHRVAISPLDHPPSLQPWCDLDGGFITEERGKVRQLQGAVLDDEIRALATAFVAADPAGQLKTLEAEIRPSTT